MAGGSGAIGITDFGKVVAVLLSEKEYEWPCACAQKGLQSNRNQLGLFILSDDADLALEQARKEIVQEFEESIQKTASTL